MLVSFHDKDLDRLEVEPEFTAGHSRTIVRAYRKRITQIRAAPDEREFYAQKSFHFEKLKGDRSHQRSMKLNDQWRLILEFEGKGPQKVAIIVSIEDYH
jgi:proteic killer suppression protein